jgi:FkbM family methyltransferase
VDLDAPPRSPFEAHLVDQITPIFDELRLLNRQLDDQAASIDRRFSEVREALRSLTDDVWSSKVVRVGDRLLVGCRHLDLVFLMQADDQLIVPRFVVDGEYEPTTTAFLKRTVGPESVCIDVGANFGYYACLMGHLAWKGQTYAYEADPEMHSVLVDNVSINWCEGLVHPINSAVGATDGELTLHRWDRRYGNSGIINPADVFAPGAGPDSHEFTVPCIALDSLVDRFERVDVVKIDVEGAESLVVEGMSKFVERYLPTVVFEWSPSQTRQAGFEPAALARAIGDWGFQVSVIGPDSELIPIDDNALPELPYQNIVLQPR